jgi:[acyl-carrier-protein] S-malonyltransferase
VAKRAYIFPGQGSQYVGMGRDLFEKSPLARELFEKADGVLGVKLSRICFEGPEDELKQTRNTQPAIFLQSIIMTKLMERDDAVMVAGHSLGEYSALVHAGVMTFEDGLRLVRLRGELMQKSGEQEKGTMAAVIGLDARTVEAVCAAAVSEGVVQPANFNAPGQVVVSGSLAGVRKAMEIAREKGAKMVKELVVSGAFHSPLMAGAMEGLSSAIAATRMQDARIPVYANVTGKPARKVDEIRSLLGKQLLNPVRWEESVTNMITEGAGSFLEIGPGKVLQGLVKRINGNVIVQGIDRFDDIKGMLWD